MVTPIMLSDVRIIQTISDALRWPGGNPGYPQSLVPRKYGSYVVFYPILWYIMWQIYIYIYTYYIDILIHPHFYSHDMSICRCSDFMDPLF